MFTFHKKNPILSILFFAFLLNACKHPVNTVENTYHYQTPLYNHTSLVVKHDTLRFKLEENVYNQIKSFNLFRENSIDYISFYDRRSESINIYYLMDQRLVKNIPLKKLFKNRQLYKTTAFVKNRDSIFVINKYTISLFDSRGHRKQKIEFPIKPSNNAAVFDSNKQPVFIGNQLYVISANKADSRSINALRNWKVMYLFDLEKGQTQLQYPLPRLYQENLYGYYFLNYNFCYNHHKKFVFSFPADTLLYETDLAGYNHSYFARSWEHTNSILPASQDDLKEKGGLKAYTTRDSYGSVFYDPTRQYYLREVRHRLTPAAFDAGQRQRRTVLIFDKQFKIIGESAWPEGIDFDTLFCTPDGQLFARTNIRDENALQFVRFTYEVNKNQSSQLANK